MLNYSNLKKLMKSLNIETRNDNKTKTFALSMRLENVSFSYALCLFYHSLQTLTDFLCYSRTQINKYC